MKIYQYFSLLALLILAFGCDKTEIEPESYYNCEIAFSDSSGNHPKAAIYQQILEDNQSKGMVGTVLLVKDGDGLWQGASGKADLATGTDVQVCNRFLIASNTKVFTATVVMALIDGGIISLEDPVTKWLPASITDKLANADEAQIKHLLSHTSGVPDYYTAQFELDRINNINNEWKDEDILAYAYGQKPDFAVGETYGYSNSGYVLLGMIAESASGKSITELYDSYIFRPLNLSSAYYGTEKTIPESTVKGYVDIYDNGSIAQSEFLYGDEMGTTDGGIVINAYDLAVFIESLAKGKLVSADRLAEMQNWFDLPAFWIDEGLGQIKNGFGIEYFESQYGYAIGHTGGVDGFSTMMFYFPEKDRTFIFFNNTVGIGRESTLDIYDRCLKEMFE